jgi:hypothetical protein
VRHALHDRCHHRVHVDLLWREIAAALAREFQDRIDQAIHLGGGFDESNRQKIETRSPRTGTSADQSVSIASQRKVAPKTAMYRLVSPYIAVALVDLCRVGKRRVRAPLSSDDRGLPRETEQGPPLHNHSQTAGSVGVRSEFTRQPLPSFTRSWRGGLLRLGTDQDAGRKMARMAQEQQSSASGVFVR